MNRSKQFILAAIPMAVAMVAAQPLVASAQSADLGRVTVTGSSIKRTEIEGPAPVQIVTRKDIERTGATTINELLRNLPAIDIFDQGELASNSPAGSGTASIRMRGLDETNTLVLLNGHRLPVNALYDSSGAGAAVDVNQIPLSIIERVEILKDGGSAIYGADAVAGVVNFITKQNYKGLTASLNAGTSGRGDATEKRFGIAGGFGNLGEDRFNVLVGIDYLKRDPLYRKDRDLSSSVDFRRFGGPDRRSSFSPFGNVYDFPNDDFAYQSYKPCPAENLRADGICGYDFNKSILTAYNGADRLSGLGVATLQITPDMKWTTQLAATRSQDTFRAHPVPDVFLLPATPGLTQFADPSDPGNVFVYGRFMQGGPRTSERESKSYSLASTLEGSNFGLDWKASIGRGENKVTNKDSNYYDLNKWTTATTNGSLDPTVTTNDAALVESLKVRPKREGTSIIEFANALVSGDAFQLPAGTLKYAVGVSVMRESLSDTPDALSQAGEVVGSIQQAAVDASRTGRAVFGELAIPVTKQIEGQLALRHDNFGGVSNTSPKVAAKYSPLSNLAFRASYSESFRMPVLKQLFGASEEGAITLTTDEECALVGRPAGCTVNGDRVTGSNPKLDPEKGKNYTLGVIYDITDNLNASVDLWRITKTGAVEVPTVVEALRSGDFFFKPNTEIVVNQTLKNLSRRETEGLDLDVRWRVPGTLVGTLTLRNTATFTLGNRKKNPAGEWQYERGNYNNPEWRNSFSANVDTGPWTWTGAVRTTAGFQDTQSTLRQEQREADRVPSYTELDIQAQYRGFKGWTVTGGIKNLTDAMPPFSLTNASSNDFSQMGFAELYNNRGRFFYASVDYKFW